MRIISLRDKRADSFIESGTGLAGALVLLIILAVAAYFTYDYFKSQGAAIAPDVSSALALFCGGAASEENAYCGYNGAFKDVSISGTNQKANCDYLKKYITFTPFTGTCDKIRVMLSARSVCGATPAPGDNFLVNGKNCKAWLTAIDCSTLKGSWANVACGAETYDVTLLASDIGKHVGEFCCSTDISAL